ncbi:MAG: hypothetical protein ACETWO_03765 [Candidatus Hadarchaeaceae archaeon]|nr:hypothetical protein [Hadesarchaea archaeon]MDH5685226.1 hypothetical protein [Hadesarchaea archaeon]
MSQIDDVFYVFGDGKWHEVEEIAEEVALPESKVKKILDFLAEFKFIEFDEGKKKSKATPYGRRILSREKSFKFPVPL